MPGVPAWLDRPIPLDPDASGSLRDDLAGLGSRWASATLPAPFDSAAQADAGRVYLFYGLYYVADWSGSPPRWRLDHVGDLEARAFSGTVAVSEEGRPI